MCNKILTFMQSWEMTQQLKVKYKAINTLRMHKQGEEKIILKDNSYYNHRLLIYLEIK